MANTRVQKFNKRLQDLESEFSTWRDHFIELSDYILPIRGRYLGRDTKPNDGSKRNDKIIDSTATFALDILASGMQSGLTSPSRPWFRLTLQDKDLASYAPVKEWLEEVRKSMFFIFSKSNFYHSVHSEYYELGCFGTGAMLVDDDKKSVIRVYPFTVGEYYLSTDDTGRVDTIYRNIWMKARNMVRKFGEDKVSLAVKNLASKQGDEYIRVVHMIEPNDEREPGKIDKLNKEFRSVYYEHDTREEDKVLFESGYDEFPVMTPRWAVIGSETYGWSPGMIALGDTKMLQKMQEKGMRALDKLIDPPMNAPTDMIGVKKSVIPGGVTYIDTQQGKQRFEPAYQINPDFQSLEYKNERVQQMIRTAFFSDVFLMLANNSNTPQMTAREVVERHEEKILMLGPVVERLQPELLDHAIDRTYNIMFRNGLVPPPPPELNGVPLEVEYISILAQAQKMVGTTAIEQLVGFAGNLAGVKPDIIDKIDFDETIDQYGDMLGVPPNIIRPDEDVDGIREQRAKQQAAQQAMESMERSAQGAKVLSETNTGENNALTQLMGSG